MTQKAYSNQFSTWPDTLRFPTSNALNATSQDDLVTSQLDNNQASYAKRYLNLLQAYPTFAKFSNKAWLSDVTNVGGSYDSLESIHDAIHGLIGNGGHMTYVCRTIYDFLPLSSLPNPFRANSSNVIQLSAQEDLVSFPSLLTIT